MKTIVLGFDNAEGTGTATVVATPEVPIAEQRALVTQIKSSRKYPKGIKRIEYCELDVKEVGILIEQTHSEKKAAAKAEAAEAKADAAEAKAEAKAAKKH